VTCEDLTDPATDDRPPVRRELLVRMRRHVRPAVVVSQVERVATHVQRGFNAVENVAVVVGVSVSAAALLKAPSTEVAIARGAT